MSFMRRLNGAGKDYLADWCERIIRLRLADEMAEMIERQTSPCGCGYLHCVSCALYIQAQGYAAMMRRLGAG